MGVFVKFVSTKIQKTQELLRYLHGESTYKDICNTLQKCGDTALLMTRFFPEKKFKVEILVMLWVDGPVREYRFILREYKDGHLNCTSDSPAFTIKDYKYCFVDPQVRTAFACLELVQKKLSRISYDNLMEKLKRQRLYLLKPGKEMEIWIESPEFYVEAKRFRVKSMFFAEDEISEEFFVVEYDDLSFLDK